MGNAEPRNVSMFTYLSTVFANNHDLCGKIRLAFAAFRRLSKCDVLSRNLLIKTTIVIEKYNVSRVLDGNEFWVPYLAICELLKDFKRPPYKEASVYFGGIRYRLSKFRNVHRQRLSSPCRSTAMFAWLRHLHAWVLISAMCITSNAKIIPLYN